MAQGLSSTTLLDVALTRLVIIHAQGNENARRSVAWVLRHGGMEGTAVYLKNPRTHHAPIRRDIKGILKSIEEYPPSLPAHILPH